MRSGIILLIALIAAIGTGMESAAAATGVHPATSGHRLRFVSAQGYLFAVAGRGWSYSAPVKFTALSGGASRALTVRPTHQGTFLIGLTSVDRCTGLTVKARDSAGRHASLHSPLLGCPAALNPPIPLLTVLKGKLMNGSASTPGNTQSGNNQPGSNQPGNTTGNNQSSNGQPGTGQPNTGQPGTGQQNTGQPAISPPAGWNTYRSQQAGFAVDYPPTWTAQESTASGELTVVFAPSGGGAAIHLTVYSGAGPDAGPSDIPNNYCRPVTVGSLTGTSCLDTMSMSTVVTVQGNGKTYIIAAIGKGLDRAIWDQLLSSFRLL